MSAGEISSKPWGNGRFFLGRGTCECYGTGDPEAEALKPIREVIELDISDLKSEGREVPRPGPSLLQRP